MHLIKHKWIKRILVLFIVMFISYTLYLNSLVKSQFSSEIKPKDNVIQVQNPIDDYPKELINMLLLVEDQSFFDHRR